MADPTTYPGVHTINPLLAFEQVCELAGPNWDFDDLKTVLTMSSITGLYVPSSQAPQTIDLGNLNKHMTTLATQGELRGGIEIGRTFLIDRSTQPAGFIYGKTEYGDENMTKINTESQHRMQTLIALMHNHPRSSLSLDGNGHNPFSLQDYVTFMQIESALLNILVMGQRYLVLIKTSVTPRVPDKQILQLIQEIADNYIQPNGLWRINDAVRANKEMCTILGLCMYYGRLNELAKRVSVVEPR